MLGVIFAVEMPLTAVVGLSRECSLWVQLTYRPNRTAVWPVKEELPEMTTVQIASETANKIIPTGKLITSFQNSFVMIHQGNVYLCIIGNSPRVACYLNK